jgi:hypothetical protein
MSEGLFLSGCLELGCPSFLAFGLEPDCQVFGDLSLPASRLNYMGLDLRTVWVPKLCEMFLLQTFEYLHIHGNVSH